MGVSGRPENTPERADDAAGQWSKSTKNRLPLVKMAGHRDFVMCPSEPVTAVTITAACHPARRDLEPKTIALPYERQINITRNNRSPMPIGK